MIELYDYYRSSASIRVRLALELKGLEYSKIAVHLLNEGGEQFSASFQALNSQSLVPCLKHDGVVVTQSLAILEYLEETFPQPPLLPYDRTARAYVRSIALSIACDIHPLINLRVIKYLGKVGVSLEDKQHWPRYWITQGFIALEAKLKKSILRGKFCYQDQPTLADICLAAQLFSAKRHHVDLTPFPTLIAIGEQCLTLPSFEKVIAEASA